MANVVVVGSQWGDEGKGKIVDWLSEQADIVVRFQGGHNAGHTLVIDGDHLQAVAAALRRGARRQAVHHRQRRGGRSAGADRRNRQARQTGRRGDAGKSAHRRKRALDPAAASRTRRGARGSSDDPHRHHQARHRPGLRGQSRPPRHPLHGPRRSALARPQDRAAAGASQRVAPRAQSRRSSKARRSTNISRRSRRRCCPIWIRSGRCSMPSGARASAFCSKARKARCSTSTTAPILTSPRPTRWRRRRRPAPASAPTRSITCSASARPTPRAWARAVPHRQMDNAIGKKLGERGREFGTVTGRARRCGWFDAVLVRQTVSTCGIDGLALTKLDILDGFDEIKVCVGYRLDGRDDRLSARRRTGAGAGGAGLRDHRRLEGADRARAVLGAIAGAGDQICPPRSRNWSAARWRCSPPARSARTPS